MEVWIVSGRTGSYEDVRTWDVGWYKTEKEAGTTVAFLNEASTEASKLNPDFFDTSKSIKFMQQFDPSFSVDSSTGTDYICYQVYPGLDFANKKMSRDQLEMLVSLAKEEK